MQARVTLWAGSILVLGLVHRLPAQGARPELLAADRALSVLSSDSGLATAVTASLDRDGVLLWPGAPIVVGPEAGRLLLTKVLAGEPARLTWQPLGIELAQDSLLGVTWGVAVATPRNTQAAPGIGRYTAAWRRKAGRWSLAALLFVGINPAATEIPQGVPLTRTPVRPAGAAGDFVAADLAFARFAADSGAPAAFRKWAAPNAIVSGGSGLLAMGPEAIAQGVAGPAAWEWHPVAAGSSTAGDLGWTAGEAIIRPERGEPNYSKYLTIWIRRSGGSIRFLTDGGNTRPSTNPH
jgi:hypothetical protein